MIDPFVKEYAYTLDPECWKSYCGKTKQFKQLMERRRNASLEKAAADIADNERQAELASRRTDLAGQWEHVARYLAFAMLNMPTNAFDLISREEREKFIDGGDAR